MKFFTLIPSGTKIDFISKFKLFLLFSLGAIALTIFGIFKVGFNYGIDFTGGTVFQANFNSPQSPESVRGTLSQLGAPDASVVASGNTQMEYIITSRTENNPNADPLHRRFVTKLGEANVKIVQVDVVGPKVGKELRMSAVLSLIYSVILITIYIWFRFDAKFAPGATIAMIHDIIVASGFYLLTGREFTITSIAALLTIAGYSVNDTIVIYDRVRELIKHGAQDLPIADTINRAINLTLSRTLLTSLITLLSIIPIAVFCSSEIQSFALTMMFGIFIGSYSTIYVAAPFTIVTSRWVKKA